MGLSDGDEKVKSVSLTDALRDRPQGRRELAPIINNDDENGGPPFSRLTRVFSPGQEKSPYQT